MARVRARSHQCAPDHDARMAHHAHVVRAPFKPIALIASRCPCAKMRTVVTVRIARTGGIFLLFLIVLYPTFPFGPQFPWIMYHASHYAHGRQFIGCHIHKKPTSPIGTGNVARAIPRGGHDVRVRVNVNDPPSICGDELRAGDFAMARQTRDPFVVVAMFPCPRP